MPKMRCNTCAGVYDSLLPDGTQYYHACPPLLMIAIDRAGARLEVAPGDVRGGDITIEQRFPDRPNKRDENVTIASFDKAGNPITAPRSVGGGAVAV